MSWTKLDDTILTNPKMLEAEELCPLAAPLLWFKALIYTNQQSLDGFVPTRMVARLLDGHKLTPKAAQALKTVGLWDEVEGGIQFHNFAKHNLTKGQREEKAQKNREDQQRYRDRNKSADTVRPYAGTNEDDRKASPEEPISASRAAAHADARPQTHPNPSQPNPSQCVAPPAPAARTPVGPESAAILAELQKHPALASVADAERADILAGRTLGKPAAWVTQAIADAAADLGGGRGGLTEEATFRKVRTFVDHARAPKPEAPKPGETLTPDQVQAIQARRGVQQGSAGPALDGNAMVAAILANPGVPLDSLFPGQGGGKACVPAGDLSHPSGAVANAHQGATAGQGGGR